jgi:hypothetical protein
MDGKNNLATDPSEPAGYRKNSHKAKLSKNNSCPSQTIVVLANRQDKNCFFAIFMQ